MHPFTKDGYTIQETLKKRPAQPAMVKSSPLDSPRPLPPTPRRHGTIIVNHSPQLENCIRSLHYPARVPHWFSSIGGPRQQRWATASTTRKMVITNTRLLFLYRVKKYPLVTAYKNSQRPPWFSPAWSNFTVGAIRGSLMKKDERIIIGEM